MNRILGFFWGGMFVLCALLGTVQTTNLFLKIALSVTAVIFFVPAALLLYDGLTEKKRALVLMIRWISLASLVLTTFFLVFTVAMVTKSIAAFNLSYFVLIWVSSALFCGRPIWWGILFLWACLFFATFLKPTSNKK